MVCTHFKLLKLVLRKIIEIKSNRQLVFQFKQGYQ